MAGGECDFHDGCGRPFVSVPLCALTHCKSSKKKRALCKFENTYLLGSFNNILQSWSPPGMACRTGLS